jgi:Predicted choline kinase involved in LPS biosynthesis
MSDLPDDVRVLARSVPGWNASDLIITPLEGGITNRNYRVRVGDETFVLRLPGAETALLGIDREAEYEAARRAEAAGAGPPVYTFLQDRGCLVTRFVQGHHVPQADLERESVLASVVGSIRAIHACPPISSTFPVFRIVEDYRRLAEDRGVTVPAAYHEASARAERIEVSFAGKPMPPTVCHNDLLNANFLDDGDHVWIVDYEYAGMGDPFFDLGNLSINNGFSPAAQELLLRLYFGSVRDVHRARLALMRIMSDFREAMWGVVQQALSTLDIDYVDYADRHFARLLASADDERFEDWLADAEARV